MDTSFDRAIADLDALHAEDPARIDVDGKSLPRELHYARRMTEWVARLAPSASDALRLAARAQHLQRWVLPRAAYPEGRIGYLRWRAEQAEQHAVTAAGTLIRAGIDAETVERVGKLVRKKSLRTDAEAQLLEDAACLTFLELDFADFASKHGDDKVIAILEKTWRKMSPAAHALVPTLALPPEARALLTRATPF